MQQLEVERHEIATRLDEVDISIEDRPEVIELLLNHEYRFEQGIYIDALYGLHDHMKTRLKGYTDRYDRTSWAARYADQYRDDLDIDDQDFTYEQQSALALSRLYLSSVSSLGHLGQFIYTNRWMRRKAPETKDAKIVYLAARKQFQEDVDSYFDHFIDEPLENVNEVLQDTVNMGRLLVNNQRWINSIGATYNHVFLGSVLSERAVMLSLQENVHPDARYGTAEEDSSPTKADVVLPLPQGDMHVQVKMKWQHPTELNIRPNKKPMNVIVPMHIIRGGLTSAEHMKLAISVTEVADKLAA